MPLSPGTRLGPYEIVAPLGEGGMGEVYRAHDTKLGRDVALKVLPDDVASDPERLKRFEREARTLAALNHPHIAQVYGFEDSGSVPALVMELVPGESLANRIARGPLPMREALEFARQIADGLEAAHDKGIIHRDLKPANVQVTPDGQVKILDFGLAKALSPGAEAPGLHQDVEDSPTITAGTWHGVILGTAAYMSPEQARGLPVDARTDIWAFGGAVYEMLTGTRAFPGPTVTDLLAQILERDPDWTTLPATTPGAVRTLIQRCLKKDARQRLHHIADARFTLEEVLAAPGSAFDEAQARKDPGLHSEAARKPTRAVWRCIRPLGLALASFALGAGVVWSMMRAREMPPREPQYFSLVLPPNQEFTVSAIAVSPDGRDIVYSAVSDEGLPGREGKQVRLYHRRLSEPSARVLRGTEHGFAPAISPDGQWVSFASPGDRTRKKIALTGGGPVVLAAFVPFLPGSGPGCWTADGKIVFGDASGPLWQVPTTGGDPEVAVPRSALESDERGMTWPVPIRNGFVFNANAAPRRSPIIAWADGRRRELVKEGRSPQLAGTGHLMFWRRVNESQFDLFAVAFDAERVELDGEPVSVLSFEGATAPLYAMSPAGTLVYRPAGAASRPLQFAWIERRDNPTPPTSPAARIVDPTAIRAPRLSPDGHQLLYSATRGGENQVLVVDLVNGGTRIAITGQSSWAMWSHDGRRIICQEPSGKDGAYGLAWRLADGSAPGERLTESRGWQQPQAVTRDGRFLVYQETGGLGAKGPFEQSFDLWLLPLSPRGEPRPLLRTPASEKLPHLSADERWMAYVSDESGTDEVWVRAFPDGETAIRVSDGGGTEPLWAPDGRTLYYRDTSGARLFAVPVTPGTLPLFGAPSVTSGYWIEGSAFGRMYDASPDGALLMLAAQTYGRELRVVLNFDQVIRRKMAEVKK
jgi:Tol biopolymer transport system component